MGKLKKSLIIRKYHYLIRPVCDWNNDRAREYISTSINPHIEGWEIVATIGYHDILA